MSSWIDKKATFQTRYQALSDYRQNQLQNDLNTLNTAVAGFISKGGVSQDPNADGNYNQLLQVSDKIQAKKRDFIKLNQDLGNAIKDMSHSYDTGDLLLENGRLQQEIQVLEKEKSEVGVDVATAELRDKVLKERDTAINRHQLFFLNNPISSRAIPFIWAFSFLFVAVGVLVFKQMFPGAAAGVEGVAETSIAESIMHFFSDGRVLISIGVAAIIVIIFLVMKILGVFDKNKPKAATQST
jgi:hypothetical protein